MLVEQFSFIWNTIVECGTVVKKSIKENVKPKNKLEKRVEEEDQKVAKRIKRENEELENEIKNYMALKNSLYTIMRGKQGLQRFAYEYHNIRMKERG